MEFAVELLLLFFLVAIVAGFLDTLAGGGGLITLSLIMLSGVPPLAALATNKLQGSVGTAIATFLILKKGSVRWDSVRLSMLCAFIGSIFGTVIVQFLNVELLNFIIPVVIFCIGLYFLFSSILGQIQSKPRMSNNTYQKMIVPVIGSYDGMFGLGTGSLFAVAGITLRGQTIIESTAIAKTLNFSTNTASLLVFLTAGKIIWSIGILMMFGQAWGARLGIHYLFKINPNLIRPIVVVLCFAILARYGMQNEWW